MTKVGVLFDVRRDPPFHSVSKLWDDTVAVLERSFDTRVHEIAAFDVDCETDAFRAFADGLDVFFALSPYYRIDRRVAARPLVAYALGSLAKGGHWLARNRDSFRTSDTLVVSSRSCARILGAIVTGPTLHVRRVPLGVDAEVYRPARDKRAIREKLGLPVDARILLYSGRISPQKNCALVLDVFAALRRRHADLHMLFVGGYDDFVVPDLQVHRSDRATFDARRRELGADVTLVPHQDDPRTHAEVIACADIGINLTTALGENYGFTQLEYQLCGLPVVCTDYGGLRDTVVEGTGGFRVPTTLTWEGVRVDVGAAISAVDRLLDDDALRTRMASEAVLSARPLASGFASGLSEVVLEAAGRDPAPGSLDAELVPELKHLQTLLDSRPGGPLGVHEEHLHPQLDFASYARVVSRVVTEDRSGSSWRHTSVP